MKNLISLVSSIKNPSLIVISFHPNPFGPPSCSHDHCSHRCYTHRRQTQVHLPPSQPNCSFAADTASHRSNHQQSSSIHHNHLDSILSQGAGPFEVAARQYLINEVKKTVQGLGVEAFPDALHVVCKTLAENSGLENQDGEHDRGNVVGLNQHTGEPIGPQMDGIFDNYPMKRQIINLGPVITSQLLLVDEVIRIGRNMRKPN